MMVIKFSCNLKVFEKVPLSVAVTRLNGSPQPNHKIDMNKSDKQSLVTNSPTPSYFKSKKA